MRNMHNTLLASVAALALFAGTGYAMAQQSPQGAGGSAGMSESGGTHAKSSRHDSGAGMQEHAQSGVSSESSGTKAGGSAAMDTHNNAKAAGEQSSMSAQGASNGTSAKSKGSDENRSAQTGNGEHSSQSAEENGSNAKNHNQAMGHEQNGTAENGRNGTENAASSSENGKNKNSAENRNGSESNKSSAENSRNGSEMNEQGRASNEHGRTSESMSARSTDRVEGANIHLSSEQKTKIRNTVIDTRNAPVARNIHFDVTVGTVVPRHVRVERVPTVIVNIYPSWRAYEYFVFNDEVIIVNPHNMKIVAILPA